MAMIERVPRSRPNVLITGTPGVGKTTLSEMLAERAGMKHIQVGVVITERGLHSGYNEEFDTLDVTEEDLDRLCDAIEPEVDRGGAVVDYASCYYFPERWFDLVVVLRTSNDVLYPRLEARGYAEAKILENTRAEIYNELEEEAREAFTGTPLMVLESETVEGMQANLETLVAWVTGWAGPV
eukprot:c28768_g1_i1.p2 GENE.c28768_g1_i1~~c28768_g1_i1.p2  ORF type:complete len:182 (+),score=35.39 c28768_g1_i1:107-652(+)